MGQTDTTIQQAAAATAEWWAGHVFGGTAGSSGDGMADALGLLAGVQGRAAEPSKRERFVAALTEHVARALDRDADRFGVTLSVDYGPEGALARIASELRLGGFPWKTDSYTYPDHIVGSVGYGAGTQLIWHAEGWEHPVCGQGQWDLDHPGGGRLPWKCSALRWHPVNEHTFDVPDPLCVAVIDRHGETKTCGRPAGDEGHRLDDEYLSRWAHEFQPGAVAKAGA